MEAAPGHPTHDMHLTAGDSEADSACVEASVKQRRHRHLPPLETGGVAGIAQCKADEIRSRRQSLQNTFVDAEKVTEEMSSSLPSTEPGSAASTRTNSVCSHSSCSRGSSPLPESVQLRSPPAPARMSSCGPRSWLSGFSPGCPEVDNQPWSVVFQGDKSDNLPAAETNRNHDVRKVARELLRTRRHSVEADELKTCLEAVKMQSPRHNIGRPWTGRPMGSALRAARALPPRDAVMSFADAHIPLPDMQFRQTDAYAQALPGWSEC